jgi:hypothetical protein
MLPGPASGRVDSSEGSPSLMLREEDPLLQQSPEAFVILLTLPYCHDSPNDRHLLASRIPATTGTSLNVGFGISRRGQQQDRTLEVDFPETRDISKNLHFCIGLSKHVTISHLWSKDHDTVAPLLDDDTDAPGEETIMVDAIVVDDDGDDGVQPQLADPGVPYYYYKRYHIIIMRVIGIRD